MFVIFSCVNTENFLFRYQLYLKAWSNIQSFSLCLLKTLHDENVFFSFPFFEVYILLFSTHLNSVFTVRGSSQMILCVLRKVLSFSHHSWVQQKNLYRRTLCEVCIPTLSDGYTNLPLHVLTRMCTSVGLCVGRRKRKWFWLAESCSSLIGRGAGRKPWWVCRRYGHPPPPLQMSVWEKERQNQISKDNLLWLYHLLVLYHCEQLQ